MDTHSAAPPKAVVFDLGKVLLDFDYRRAVLKLQKRCRLPFSELESLINQSPLLHRYETNLLSTGEFFQEVQELSGYCGSLAEFRESFGDIFTEIEPMVKLHASLRRQGVPTYIFSNTNEIAVEHIRQRFPFFANFDGYILSFEHNAMKPDQKLYQVVERVTRQSGRDLLYIDDRPENIASGEARGWISILHLDPGQTEAEVRKAGLLDQPNRN